MADDSNRSSCSRRRFLNNSAAFVAGGLIGSATGMASAAAKRPGRGTAELPWPWAPIDPMEAGSRAFRYFHDAGGCGNGGWLGVLSLQRDAVGSPWTLLPDTMFANLAAGYGGQGTLCGALGVASQFFNLVAFDQQRTYAKMTDELFQWYSRTVFPTTRFDAICHFPGQVQELAKSPLCHVSVSQWTLAAGAEVTSKQKKDRCAKVTGEVIYRTVEMLNEYVGGAYTMLEYPFAEENAACLSCHGADDMWHEKDGMDYQQGKMTCNLCHSHLFE